MCKANPSPPQLFNPEKDTCLLSGEGLGNYFEGLHGVSENNPKLRLFCLTSCTLSLKKNKGYSINVMRKRLLQPINWQNNQEKWNRNTVLRGSLTASALTYSVPESHTCNSYQLVWLTRLIYARNTNLIKDQEHM